MVILYEYVNKDDGTDRVDNDTDNDDIFNQSWVKPMSLPEMAAFISTSSIYSSVIDNMIKSEWYYKDCGSFRKFNWEVD